MSQNAEQLLREANLRYTLVRLRENAESIAFYGGEAQEATQVSKRLGGAIDNRRVILGTQRNLEFFTVGYSYLVQILPVLVVSPLYFAGTVELGYTYYGCIHQARWSWVPSRSLVWSHLPWLY